MLKSIYIIILINLISLSVKGQSTELNLGDFIDGTWKVEARLPVVNLDNPEASEGIDYNQEVIGKSDTIIVFKNENFEISKLKKGSFYISGHGLYLEDVRYEYAIISENKFSLIRIISSDLMIAYMIHRKCN